MDNRATAIMNYSKQQMHGPTVYTFGLQFTLTLIKRFFRKEKSREFPLFPCVPLG